jgi:arylsulfatase A-like enzyme
LRYTTLLRGNLLEMLHALVAAALWQPSPGPNILLIFSDDHARQAIGAYGSKLISTPGINRLSEEGVRFDRHYTTNPICAPSRATLLTGKYSHLNGVRDNGSVFDGSQETFPKMLRGAGYETAIIGKWHLASNPTGFDHWEVLPGQGAYYNPEFLNSKGKTVSRGYVTEIITKKATEWLGLRRSKPFFLLVGHKAPHRSWIPGPNELTLNSERTLPEPGTLRTNYEGLCSAAKTVSMRLDRNIRPAEDLMVEHIPPNMDEAQQSAWKQAMARQDADYFKHLRVSDDLLATNYQRYMLNYLRCVAGIDRSVTDIYAYLQSKDLLKNTVVIYASDQGFFLGENGWYDKRWFYEPSAGTPLIIRPANGVTRSKFVSSLTSNLDLAPTILELAGLRAPVGMQGSSLMSHLTGKEPAPGNRVVYGHFYESNDGDHQAPRYVAVCTVRHKLVFYYELNEWELFDVARDPAEAHNLWPLGVQNQVKIELMRKLKVRQRELNEEPSIIRLVEDATH